MKFSSLSIVLVAALALVLASCGGLSEAEEHYNTGVGLQEQGLFEEAIADYDEAIRLTPEDADAYNNRGNAHDELGQYERAIEDYDEAIRLIPQDARGYVGRALAYTLLGDDVAAQLDVERAVELGVDPALLKEIIDRLKAER